MKKLDVLQIINRPSITGGMELYTLNLARELRKSGHNVTLALRSGTEFFSAARAEDFKTIPITRGGALQPYNIYSISSFLLKNKCDILHAHTGNDYWPPLLAKWLTLSSGARVFVTRHILSAPRGFSSKFYFQHVNTVCVSKAVYQTMQNFSARGSKMKMIYPGIKLENFRPSETEPSFRNKFNFCAGDYVIAAMHKWFEKTFVILEKILSAFGDAKIIIAGELKKNEIAMIESSPYKNRIFICGVIKNMAEFYRSANMFLFPSFDEAFGLVVAEAMAMGLPVVTASTGGASEIFEDGSCGYKVDINDTAGFVSAVSKIKNDPALSARLGEAGINLARNYDMAVTAAEMQKAYYESLG